MPALSAATAAQDVTPMTTFACESIEAGQSSGTPAMMGDMTDMAMSTPMAGIEHMAMELDQMYIDMMIPHHASIVAMAQTALPLIG